MKSEKLKFSSRGIRMYRVQGDYPTRKAIQLHPDLKQYLKTRHPPRIRKDDPEILKIYNRYIAADVYGLDLRFYPGAIIPTPILRYNFLKHVIRKHSTVLEIGTGATAIIAMLAARLFKCQVTATEIDVNYYNWAKRLILDNQLSSKISLFLTPENKMITGVIEEKKMFDFIVSNPPYYDQILSPKNPWGGRSHELVSEGDHGEIFCEQLINEGWLHLKPGGTLAFIIPKTRVSTLLAIEAFLHHRIEICDYDIIGLLVGNRTRYIFRIHKPHPQSMAIAYEMG